MLKLCEILCRAHQYDRNEVFFNEYHIYFVVAQLDGEFYYSKLSLQLRVIRFET